jgi:hypothetical protein
MWLTATGFGTFALDGGRKPLVVWTVSHGTFGFDFRPMAFRPIP